MIANVKEINNNNNNNNNTKELIISLLCSKINDDASLDKALIF